MKMRGMEQINRVLGKLDLTKKEVLFVGAISLVLIPVYAGGKAVYKKIKNSKNNN